ncbi:MAG TPA: class II aldolase/adducin family protein [Acidimicrobiia bacterium]|nr:class II aldolase/adducin family protein [Acidimicrobiia bacterium]
MNADDPRFKVAAARRILARNGCESRVAGHVSMRAEGEDAFWVTPFEYFDETLPDHVIKVAMDLTLLEGDWEPSPAIRFHAGIYRARPDVSSVIHTHSHWVSLFATRRETIGMYNVVSVLFFDDQALYEDDGETHPVADPELMAHALGSRRVLLMKNHGAVIASQSLEHATIEACMLEVAAQYHIEAEAIGGSEFPEAEVRRGREKYHKYFLPQMWDANLRRLQRSDPDLWAWLDGDGAAGAP